MNIYSFYMNNKCQIDKCQIFEFKKKVSIVIIYNKYNFLSYFIVHNYMTIKYKLFNLF